MLLIQESKCLLSPSDKRCHSKCSVNRSVQATATYRSPQTKEDRFRLHRGPGAALNVARWPGTPPHKPHTDEWTLGPTDPREKPLSLEGFIKFEQPVEHLALILIETVRFWLFSGLAYFPSSVSVPVVSDLMKLNGLHLIPWAQEKLQNACSPLSPFWNMQNKSAVSCFGLGAQEFKKQREWIEHLPGPHLRWATPFAQQSERV